MKKLFTSDILDYKVVGIYKIVCNGKQYIGSSVNITQRLKVHVRTLRNKTHHNKTFQNLYNKYKEEQFEFCVLEECSKDILIKREKYYIDLLKPYINHILDPIKIKRDKTYKLRLSKGLKKAYKDGLIVWNRKPIHKYSLDGKYLASFVSATHAIKSLGLTDPGSICSCARGETLSANGFRWSYNKLVKLESINYKYFVRKVVQYNLEGKLVKKWNSLSEALKTLGISNIARAVKYGRTAGGFYWK